jgi:hypothetical protein
MSFDPRIGQSSRRFSGVCRHQPVVTQVERTPAARTRWRSLASRGALADHQLLVAGGRIVFAGEPQPVVGDNDDLGGGPHGATLGQVAAEGAALVVGDRQVQVAAVLRQGAGEGDNLEGALPGAMFGAAGKPQPGTGQAADFRSAPSPPGPLRGRRAPAARL